MATFDFDTGWVTGRAKAIEAEERASKWLADGNEALERGNDAKAERCYEKAQFWLDRFNKLSGNF